nr:hypothetical protein MACL_00003541 [Theileria orientalis]
MFKYITNCVSVSRILQISQPKLFNLGIIATTCLEYPKFNKLRHYSKKTEPDDKEDETIHISHGPKDTLLILGYNVKQEDLNSHIKALEETLKLKLMTLDFYSPDIAQSFSDIAMAQHQSLEFINKAKENYMKAYEIWKRLKGEESREVANILCLLGVVYRDLGDIESAKKSLLYSLAIDRKLDSLTSKLCSVYSLNNLASIAHLEEKYAEACEYYEEALRILLTATTGDENHRLISVLYYNLACSYYQIPDYYNASVSINRVGENSVTVA